MHSYDLILIIFYTINRPEIVEAHERSPKWSRAQSPNPI